MRKICWSLSDFHRIDQDVYLRGDIIFIEVLIDQGPVYGGIHTNDIILMVLTWKNLIRHVLH